MNCIQIWYDVVYGYTGMGVPVLINITKENTKQENTRTDSKDQMTNTRNGNYTCFLVCIAHTQPNPYTPIY